MWYVIVVIISVAISLALAPKPPQQKPPSLEDLEIPTAEQGRPIPVIFGVVRLKSPNIVWYGDLDFKPVYSDGGGK